MEILETHIVPAIPEKVRLQEYAHLVFKSLPTRTAVKKAIKREEIRINKKVAGTGDWIEQGQEITLIKQESKPTKVFQLKLEIILEDEFLAVINKPAGIPTSGNYFRTVENALLFNLNPSSQLDALPQPRPVHRLDNPTSGLLIIAKTRTAQTILSRDLQNKTIRKTYLALVHGSIAGNTVYTDDLDGKPAHTEIQLLKHLQIAHKDFSLVEASPATGRTHQIRKHLSLNGNAIVGDKEYGTIVSAGFSNGLYLAAIALDFTHPILKTAVSLTLPWPLKFRRL